MWLRYFLVTQIFKTVTNPTILFNTLIVNMFVFANVITGLKRNNDKNVFIPGFEVNDFFIQEMEEYVEYYGTIPLTVSPHSKSFHITSSSSLAVP